MSKESIRTANDASFLQKYNQKKNEKVLSQIIRPEQKSGVIEWLDVYEGLHGISYSYNMRAFEGDYLYQKTKFIGHKYSKEHDWDGFNISKKP